MIVVGVGSVYGGSTTKQGIEVHVMTGELTSQTSLSVMYEPFIADETELVDDVCKEPDTDLSVLEDALDVRVVSRS